MAEHGIGIIGCGMIAEFHARAIDEIEEARVVAVCSRTRSNAEKVAGISGHDCLIYDDLDAMLRHPDLDVVCVCTPSGAHMEPAVQAARAGKHVIVEKPLEIDLSRCDAIIEACEAAGVRLCAIFPSRFAPANRRLKEAVDSGRFGRLTLGDTHVKWWRTQGVLRFGWLARDVAARRGRGVDEPGYPQRRPSLLADGRRGVGRRPDGHPGPHPH